MSEERFWAEGSMSKEDLGDVISLFRGKTKLGIKEFAESIGCTERILESSENGKGAHVYGTFIKMCEVYALSTKMTVEESSVIFQ